MAVRRRGRPAAKAGPGAAPAPKVHALETLDQWRALVAKAGATGRLVAVSFYQAQNYACMQMRPYYRRMSVDGPLRAAVFAEVEVDVAEPELLEECGVRQGVTRIPYFACYVDGEVVETYSGGVPAEVAKMLQRQVASLKAARGHSLTTKLLVAAAGAAALAGALWWRLGRGGSGGSTRDLHEELRSVAERIALAQKRLSYYQQAGKLGRAKAQTRLLQQLEAQQRTLHGRLRQKDDPAAAAAASSKAKAAKAAKAKRRAARRAEASSDDDEDGGEVVLYSDEEE